MYPYVLFVWGLGLFVAGRNFMNFFNEKSHFFWVITEGSETNSWIWCIFLSLLALLVNLWTMSNAWVSYFPSIYTYPPLTNISLPGFSHCYTKIHHCHLIIHYNLLNPLNPSMRSQGQFTHSTTSIIFQLSQDKLLLPISKQLLSIIYHLSSGLLKYMYHVWVV